MVSSRMTIMGTRHVISAGHYLAAHAGFQVLEAGGNAIDAGVAAGLAIGVLQTDKVNIGGVAPQIIYTAKNRKVHCIDGLGVWPQAVTPDYFMKRHGGRIPPGVERCVVPAAPDAWITALANFGTPGGDVQPQAMLQVFLNINAFGMSPQDAIEAPRFSTYSYPGSFEPHPYFPRRLYLESRIDKTTGAELAQRGHKIYWWDDMTWLAGAVCAIVADHKSGVLHGGADPRRPAYVLGW